MSASPDLSDRLLARADRLEQFYGRRGRAFRVAWVAVGLVVALGGVALLALPGPGLLVVLMGLAMVSPAWPWARDLMRRAIVLADRAHDWVTATRARRRLSTVLSVLAAAGAGALAVWTIL